MATAIGVFFAGSKLWLSKKQATTQFEDDLSREYRAIAKQIPVSALLGEPLSEETYRETLGDFYHYVDLTNEQIFLRLKGRVTMATWENWQDGIRVNMSRPAILKAWTEIKKRAPESFVELRRLEAEKYSSDPRNSPNKRQIYGVSMSESMSPNE